MLNKNIFELLNFISEPNKSNCLKILNENLERFKLSPGSLSKHQTWEGGYLEHLEETMNLGMVFFKVMNDFRKLDFTISDVFLVLFLHDLEKPFRYVEPKIEFKSDEEKQLFIQDIIQKNNIILDEIHENALKYIHGEGESFDRNKRIQMPLAAFCHICDVASARI